MKLLRRPSVIGGDRHHWISLCPGVGLVVSLLLALPLPGCSLAPSTQKQAVDLKNKISNAIGEVGELRNTLTTQVSNIQNDAKMWVIALGVVCILAASFPCLLLLFGYWLVKRWLTSQTQEVCQRLGPLGKG